MKFARIVALSLVAVSLGVGGVEASTLSKSAVPAEVPPASFKGKQYVDSRGCVFIRAGIDGMVTWVPRVTRSREVLCGYQPTFAKADNKPAPATEMTAKEPETKPVEAAAAAPAEPAPKVEPVAKVAEPAPVPAPKPAIKKATAKPAPKPAPAPRRVVNKPVVTAAAKPSPAPIPARTSRALATHNLCTEIANGGAYYSGAETAVRCGPQTQAPATIIRRENVTVMRAGKPVTVQRRVAAKSKSNGNLRVVPRHIWEQQQAATAGVSVPEGYRPVWTDDRLNKRRAHQTLDGIRSTELIWTRTVPRELYVRKTGKIVTDDYPNLIYPYISYREMQDAGYSIADNGAIPGKAPGMVRRSAGSKKVKSLISTKASPAPATTSKAARLTAPKAAKAGRYVQVGMFSVPANAQRTASRLQATGLPVRMGTMKKGGKSFRLVMAGPFAQDQIGAALSKARSAGFRDAFVR